MRGDQDLRAQGLRGRAQARKLRLWTAMGRRIVWYVIHGTDRDNSLEARLAARSAHLQRLRELQGHGRLLTAGPLPAIDAEDPGPAGYSGSLVIARFESLAEARAWADEDPYVDAGVYERLDVFPFRRVLPE